MRLTCILLVAVASLVGVLDASVATTGNTVVAKAAMVISPLAPESQGRRSLRLVDDDEDDSADEKDDEEEESADEVDEERGWGLSGLTDKLALTSVASKFVGKSADEMGEVLKKLDESQINTLFDKGEDSIQKLLPGFYTGMDFKKFDDLINGLPMEQQALMMSAYTKYLDNKGLLSSLG